MWMFVYVRTFHQGKFHISVTYCDNKTFSDSDCDYFLVKHRTHVMYKTILTGKRLNIYGIKSTDLEEKKGKLSENMCECQTSESKPSWLSRWWNNWPPGLPAASSSTSRLQLCHAVTLSVDLINNMLTLGRTRLGSIFSNSWEVRWR